MTLNKTDRIVITLGKQIVHGKYVPGSPLPAEAELCEEFATSRNIIREVFRSLMAKRLIEMKRYRGAFVAPRNQWNYLDTDVLQWVLENDYDPRLISAMSEVRNLVEPAIARWAAERATSSDLAQIESALNEMIANNQDREAFNEADIRYHEAVLQSVHNPGIIQILSPTDVNCSPIDEKQAGTDKYGQLSSRRCCQPFLPLPLAFSLHASRS